jgi:FSR family fosmidomycin resistance protein-like MFS transporter
MLALSVGHAGTDLAQGAISTLLVFLKPELDLSYTEVTAVILVSTIASSVIQPAFGLLSDRRGAVWLLPAGVGLSGVGVALACVAPSYPLLLLAIFVSGIGVAAYHPEASKFAAYVSGRRKAGGMSLFSIGGNVGFSFGPLLANGLIAGLGLSGGLMLALPAVAIAVGLAWVCPYLLGFSPAGGKWVRSADEHDRPRALALLLTIVSLRSVGHMGLFTFIPLWEVANGFSERRGSVILTAFLAAGAAGTLFGGPIADRVGKRAVLFATLVAAVPLILVYVLVGGVVGDVSVALSGAMLISSFAITIVMSQEYLPTRVGLASGLAIGFAIGLGGVAAVVLGAVADAIDLRTAVVATAAGPAAAAVLTLALPVGRRRAVQAPAGVPA